MYKFNVMIVLMMLKLIDSIYPEGKISVDY